MSRVHCGAGSYNTALLRRTIAAAAAVLITTPEYNGWLPGSLKNVVDWASRPFPDNAWRDNQWR